MHEIDENDAFLTARVLLYFICFI